MTDQPQFPPADPGNPFLSETPAVISATPVTLPDQQPRLLVTMRAGNGTLTAFLKREQALSWAATISGQAERVSSLIVPGAVHLPPVQNGHKP
jgi:hypothetical protein